MSEKFYREQLLEQTPDLMKELERGGQPSHESGLITPPEYADDALAVRFTEAHSDRLRYTGKLREWRLFDGTRWREDATLRVFDLVRMVCRQASATCVNPPLARAIASAGKVSAVETLARSDPRHAATVEQWDADPMMLNTPSGTVDLRTGEMAVHTRELYCTKITAVAPGGDCPMWLDFLNRITNGDAELQRFIQIIAGYCLTGVTREQVLFPPTWSPSAVPLNSLDFGG